MASSLRYTLIVAATLENGIGFANDLPWRLPKDQAYFKRVTSRIPKCAMPEEFAGQPPQNAVIMGRLTWESIPVRMRPLSKRFNIVISRNEEYFKYVPCLLPQGCLISLEKGRGVSHLWRGGVLYARESASLPLPTF